MHTVFSVPLVEDKEMLNMVHKMDITLLLHMQTGWLYSWMNGTVVGA